jgi:hypothetical protein
MTLTSAARYRATIANATDYTYSWYGPGGENSLVRLARSHCCLVRAVQNTCTARCGLS